MFVIPQPPAGQRFTSAESEVIEGIANGWHSDRIAEWLGILPGTVRVIVSHIAHKLPEHGGLQGYAKVLYWLSARDALTDQINDAA